MEAGPWTEADFDRLSWHDCSVYGVAFDVDAAGGRSDLRLDIDFIVEWICGEAGRATFRIAPATLVFHHATDARIAIEPFGSASQIALFAPQISSIARERVLDQRVCLDRPYFAWTIELATPGGRIAFGASGFTQTLRRAPVVSSEQQFDGPR